MAIDLIATFIDAFCERVDIGDPSASLSVYGVSEVNPFYLNQAMIFRIAPNSIPILFDNLAIPAFPRATDGVYLIFDENNIWLFFAGLGEPSSVVTFVNDSTFTLSALLDAFKAKVTAAIWDAYAPPVASLTTGLLGWYPLTTDQNDTSGGSLGNFNLIREVTFSSTQGVYFAGSDQSSLYLPYSAGLDLTTWTMAIVAEWDPLGATLRQEQTLFKRWAYASEAPLMPANEEQGVAFTLIKGTKNNIEFYVAHDGATLGTFDNNHTLVQTPDNVVVGGNRYLVVVRCIENKEISLTWFLNSDPTPNKVTQAFLFAPSSPQLGLALGAQEFNKNGVNREPLRGYEKKFGVWGRNLSAQEVQLLHNGGQYWNGP